MGGLLIISSLISLGTGSSYYVLDLGSNNGLVTRLLGLLWVKSTSYCNERSNTQLRVASFRAQKRGQRPPTYLDRYHQGYAAEVKYFRSGMHDALCFEPECKDLSCDGRVNIFLSLNTYDTPLKLLKPS